MAPRSTFYIALKETSEYDAVFLEDLTVVELTKRLAQCIGIQVQPPRGFFFLPRGLYLKTFLCYYGSDLFISVRNWKQPWWVLWHYSQDFFFARFQLTVISGNLLNLLLGFYSVDFPVLHRNEGSPLSVDRKGWSVESSRSLSTAASSGSPTRSSGTSALSRSSTFRCVTPTRTSATSYL